MPKRRTPAQRAASRRNLAKARAARRMNGSLRSARGTVLGYRVSSRPHPMGKVMHRMVYGLRRVA